MHPAADSSSDRTGRSHHIRFWKIVWRSGGPWERLFVAWFWIGLGLAVTIAIGARLWLDSPPGEWRRSAPRSLRLGSRQVGLWKACRRFENSWKRASSMLNLHG